MIYKIYEDMKEWAKLIKDNKLYLIISIVGLVLLAIGGVYVTTTIGKIFFCIGIAFSILSIIMGLRNKSLEWEEFD